MASLFTPFSDNIDQYFSFFSTPPVCFTINLSGSIEPHSKSAGPMGPIESLLGPIEPLSTHQLFSLVLAKYTKIIENAPILIDRHRKSIKNIYSMFSDFSMLATETDDIAILSHEINRLEASLADLIGIISPDEVLASIFSNFCIGK